MKDLWRVIAGTMDAMIAPSFGAPGYYARKRTWESESLPADLEDRLFVVTGANSGIGYATTRLLAERGATVVMGCRNEERGVAARDRMKSRVTGELELELVDMSSLSSVKQLAERLRGRKIDGLVHNAGALVHERSLTDDGLELTFACHVAGPMLLTTMLRETLEKRDGSRVIFVSSGGMYTQQLRVDELKTGGRQNSPFDGVVTYAQCKRAQVLLAHELAARSDGGIGFASMHPGWVDTKGVQESLPGFHKVTKSFLRTDEQGADTVVYLAITPDHHLLDGSFFFDRLPRREHLPLRSTQSSGEEISQLWDLVFEVIAPFDS